MRFRSFARASLAALLLFAAVPAHAGIRPWVSGVLGASTLAMQDINDEIGVLNAGLGADKLELDEMKGGLNVGGAFGLDLGRSLSVGVAYDRMLSQSESASHSGYVQIDVPGEIVRGFARYAFMNVGQTRAFVELSGGRARTLAGLTTRQTGGATEHFGLEGSGAAYEFAAGLATPSDALCVITASLGWRSAKVDDIRVEEELIQNVSGGSFSTDYSGVFARVGVQFMLWPYRDGKAASPADESR